jgi:multidrug efflux pump subunit AcrB
MNPARLTFHRPVLTGMVTLIVILLGLAALNRLPVDLLPDITYPVLTVTTSIMLLGVGSSLDPVRLRGLIDNRIGPRLERPPGVAAVDIRGGLQREIRIDVMPERLQAIGVVLALLVTGTTLNVQSLIGVMLLVGIVVNNAILLVDRMARLHRGEGMAVQAAVPLAARQRLRPILMTTLTPILVPLPLAFGTGDGGEAQAPMARVVIGGLLSVRGNRAESSRSSEQFTGRAGIGLTQALLLHRGIETPGQEPVPF